ncbi:MAG: hypothetical protein K6A41_06995 [Bacteroidales bacterium]|nr:hypothetical protein [Bacteroidales bacterium]
MREDDYFSDKEAVIQRQYQLNPWFTPEFIKYSYQIIKEILDVDYLKSRFSSSSDVLSGKTIGLVPDGMMPMSAFVDMLCVLIMGGTCALKLHPKDELLMSFLIQELEEVEPMLKHRISVVDKLPKCDAIIVNDMEDSHAIWERYLQQIPHLLRPRQASVAILTGHESEQELVSLSKDISLFFGRSRAAVHTVFVPRNYDFVPFLRTLGTQTQSLAQHHQFLNHLEYQKSIRLMNKQFYMDAGTFLFVEQIQEIAPTGVIHYAFYQDVDEAQEWLNLHRDEVYCVVSQAGACDDGKPFGTVFSDKDFPLDSTVHFLMTI